MKQNNEIERKKEQRIEHTQTHDVLNANENIF